MPVSTENSVSGPYTPNGVTTDFAFDFKATSADEVVALDQDGAAISSALYSVTLDDDEGGTLSFSAAPVLADYSAIYVAGDPALTQPSDFDNAGPSFNPASLTRALDRAAARDLKQQRVIERAIAVPFGETGLTLPAAADRLGYYLGFDANGNAVALDGTGDDGTVRPDLASAAKGAAMVALAQGGKVSDAIKFVTPQMFGAVGDGTTDDTAAFQDALDSGLPNKWPIGEYLITDTLLLEPGVVIIGDGGKANYDESPVQIRFTPTTKRDLFNWRSPRTDAPYEFGGCRIEGFCVRGFGPGADACLDLPLLYNGYIDFYAFAGIDVWIRPRRWQDWYAAGGSQGHRVAGVDFAKAGSVSDPASDVTTTGVINAYVSQGPIGFRATERAVTDCRLLCTAESLDNAVNYAAGNALFFDGFLENVPRTNAGAAFVVGKTGSAGAEQTSAKINVRSAIGWTGGTPTATTLLDVGKARYVEVSGAAYEYAFMLETTADTQQVVFNGTDTDNITYLSDTDGIADLSVISGTPFLPKNMLRQPSATEFLDLPVWTRSLDMIPRERSGVPNGKIYADKTYQGKLIRRDDHGNFTAPIGSLRTSSIAGPWTFQGARTVPGEMVIYTGGEPGAPWGFKCTRFGKDTANSYAGCSTTSGSPVITNPTVGTFFLCEVGDYVTVSAGFGDAVAQRRVIARAANLTSITVDSNATSTVSGTVGVSTEVHKLLPVGQQGHRETGADPTGALVPFFVGERVLRTDTANWYRSTGPNSSNWKLLT